MRIRGASREGGGKLLGNGESAGTQRQAEGGRPNPGAAQGGDPHVLLGAREVRKPATRVAPEGLNAVGDYQGFQGCLGLSTVG